MTLCEARTEIKLEMMIPLILTCIAMLGKLLRSHDVNHVANCTPRTQYRQHNFTLIINLWIVLLMEIKITSMHLIFLLGCAKFNQVKFLCEIVNWF
jgi:hypothetical protein